MSTPDERLALLEAKCAISELRARYAWHGIHGEVDKVVALFTEDCVFETGGSAGKRIVLKSKAEVAEFLGRTPPKLGAVIPLIHN